MIAAVLGFGLQISQIRACRRLRVALCPPYFAATNGGQMLSLLGFVSVDQKCWAQHPQPLTIQRWTTTQARHLLLENFGLLGVKPGAAIFDRPLWRSKASITTGLKPLLSVLTREYPSSPTPNLLFAHNRLSLRERTIRVQPTGNLSTKLG